MATSIYKNRINIREIKRLEKRINSHEDSASFTEYEKQFFYFLNQNIKRFNKSLEAKIISEAGKINAITIATNMAGRGTDIKLGGKSENENGIEIDNKENEDKVKSIGGLCVIGTERHESRRIDNQLRGRSGRQGDPGTSIFFISLQDELMRLFGGDQIDGMLKKLGLKENESIDHPWINKAMEGAQKKVESRNFDIYFLIKSLLLTNKVNIKLDNTHTVSG